MKHEVTKLEIAYVLLYFPNSTETFIAQEIWEIQQQGVEVGIFSLLQPKLELVHPVSERLMAQVQYAPEIYSISLWWAQIYYCFKMPRRYYKLLWKLLSQSAPDISFRLRRTVIFLKSVHLAKKLEGSRIQLVHTHFAWLSAAAGMVISQLLDMPFTITTHAFDIYSRKNDLLSLTSSAANRIVTISNYNKKEILQQCPQLKDDQVKVIHCGIDTDEFQPSVERPDTIYKEFRILSVGSLLEKKGHEYLIRACGQLYAQGVNFQCTIIGEGNQRNRLEKLIVELGLENTITLAGTQKQTWVRDMMQDSHLFVLACVVTDTGERDGIPVAIMEALAMELPVVSTRVSGIPELVHHEITGLLVPERDAIALAEAIFRIKNDEILRRKITVNGRKLVAAEFDTHKNVAQLLNLFHQVVEEYGDGH